METTKTWMDRWSDAHIKQSLLENEFYDAIESLVTFFYDDYFFDYYDASVEFTQCSNKAVLSEDAQRKLTELGICRCWLNHKDGSETVYCSLKQPVEGYRHMKSGGEQTCKILTPGTTTPTAGPNKGIEMPAKFGCSRRIGHAGNCGQTQSEDLILED
jgi:hypothetical protein